MWEKAEVFMCSVKIAVFFEKWALRLKVVGTEEAIILWPKPAALKNKPQLLDGKVLGLY